MSTYKRKRAGETTPEWRYDFELGGRRFVGGAGATSQRQARLAEALARKAAKAALAAEAVAAGAPLTLEAAAAKYWLEIGQHHVNADTTLADLLRLQTFFDPQTPLAAIDDAAVADLVRWRRAQFSRGKTPKPLAPATVNRTTIEPLQKLFSRARKVWKLAMPNEPAWRAHTLREPQERVREVRAVEETVLRQALTPDYYAVVALARATGLRLQNCLLKKSEVDLADGVLRVTGKGGKAIRAPITREARNILEPAMANPTAHVFTYAAARAKKTPGAAAGGVARGQRVPITVSGLKTAWRRARARGDAAGLPRDLRFHDLRHDFATKLLRATGNLKLVQKALHHSKVDTTTKYAHVLDDEVLAGMELASLSRLEAAESPIGECPPVPAAKSPAQKSRPRKNSRPKPRPAAARRAQASEK
jgi:integrase